MFSIKSPENHVNCIYGVIRPLYLIGRLIGFFPFSVNIQMNGKNSKVYFTLIDFTVFVIHVSVYVLFAYVNIKYNFLETPLASPLLLLGTRSLLIFGILLGIICISADLCNRFRIFRIFDQCQNFDVQMKALGSQLNYKRNKLGVNVYLLVWMVVSMVFYVVSFFVFINLYECDALLFIFPSYFVMNNVFGVVSSIYTFFLFSIKARYSLLNENISRITGVSRTIKVVATSKRDTVEILMRVAGLHDLLNDILEMVNRCYSPQIMLAVGLCFTYNVFCLFSCYHGWITRVEDDYKQFSKACILTLWSVYCHCFVVPVLWAGHTMRNEGKFTGTILHRAINRCSNAEIVGRLLAFSQQLNHRIPEAHCNLFSFDWALLHSLVAATATYLIILIQFDASGYYPGVLNATSAPLLSN